MGFAETMRILSGINCGLASFNGYLDAKSSGVDRNTAMYNLFSNIGNGLARNEVAYEMQKMGNPLGNNINMYAGYGSTQANITGTIGLMTACNPWMFFNSPFLMPYSNYRFGYHMQNGFWC
ncbi:hypothetical protein J6G99_06305 [bacterium]|nr:hypothetical protein [bacterium]